MKIKRFNEQLNYNLPEIVDYVICENEDEAKTLNSYIDNKIGIIINVRVGGFKYPYVIKYNFDKKILKDLELFTAYGY